MIWPLALDFTRVGSLKYHSNDNSIEQEEEKEEKFWTEKLPENENKV
jgi:hypothetical protein